MFDIEKAKKDLGNYYSPTTEPRERERAIQSLSIIYKALEKQIPKDAEISSYNVAFCPVCHGSVWQIQSESKYCFRCGQALNFNC